MQEWLNWPAWKASKRQKRFRGSNPLLSAKGKRFAVASMKIEAFLLLVLEPSLLERRVLAMKKGLFVELSANLF